MTIPPSHFSGGSGQRPDEPELNVRELLGTHEAILKLKDVVFTVKINIVKKRFSREDFFQILNALDLDVWTQIRLQVLTGPVLQLQKGELVNKEVCDHIVMIADVFSVGYSAFQEVKLFRYWLEQPNESLLGCVPIGIMDSRIGLEMVKRELLRIAHSIT